MSDVKFRDSEIGRIVRGIAILVSAILMILPAYLNYELGITKIGL